VGGWIGIVSLVAHAEFEGFFSKKGGQIKDLEALLPCHDPRTEDLAVNSSVLGVM
jgi:hypothetical protein